MKIVVDAMGGDFAPQPEIDGSLQAIKEFDYEIIFCGDKNILEPYFKKHKINSSKISICNATQSIGMHEKPSEACKTKKDASILVGMKLVAEKKADALVSAGNSGATVASALINLHRLYGVSRPAIATLLPTITGYTLLLDAGANVNCKPKHLFQFAIMGSVFMKVIFKIPAPKVGLISIGEEEIKGDELTIQTHKLLQNVSTNGDINFIGNIEGKDIPKGKADVVVCDGFVGNVVLKFGEGVAQTFVKFLKDELRKHPLAWLGIGFFYKILKDIKKKIDYDEYGGAPLLGVNGTCIIAHGASTSKAIKNAIRIAGLFVKNNINAKVSQELIKYHKLLTSVKQFVS